VAVLVGGNGDEPPAPIPTSTTSTTIAAAVLTSTTSTVSVTSTACFFFSSTGCDVSRRHPSMQTFAFQSAPPAAITTSANSTTAPGTETNIVSDTSPECSFFFCRTGAMSHAVIFHADIYHPVRAPRRHCDQRKQHDSAWH
jgi:hypothetical protein